MSESTIERYEIIERLGVGGMAEVFRARARGIRGFSKEVAIKRILPSLSQDQAFVDLFVREAKLTVALNHPNVVQVLDLGIVGESVYIAMELVDGVDLDKVLDAARARGAPIEQHAVFAIAQEVLKGLDHAHRRTDEAGKSLGIIHRDLTPSNILLSREGVVKITDFGIAQAMQADLALLEGAVVGKVAYMSPEQARGCPLDGRSDLYSLALVVHELLTNRPALGGESMAVTLERARRGGLPPPSAQGVSLDLGVERVLMRALAVDPGDRYPDSRLFAQALGDACFEAGLRVDSPCLVRLMEDLGLASSCEAEARLSTFDSLLQAQMARTLLPGRRGPTFVFGPAASPFEIVSDSLEGSEGPREAPSKGRPRRLWWLALVILLPLVTAAAWVLQSFFIPSEAVRVRADVASERPQAVAGRILISSVPEGAEIFRDGRPTGLVTPAEIPGIAPGVGMEVSLSLAGHQGWRQALTVRPGETLTYHVLLRPQEVTVRIESRPEGAEVRVDGRLLGKTPVDWRGELDFRDHEVEVVKRRHEAERRVVRLGGEVPERLEVVLRRSVEYGVLNINADPWAQVYVDGRLVRKSTPAKGLKLSAGSHRVRLVNPVLHLERTITVDVPPGGSVTKVVDLRTGQH